MAFRWPPTRDMGGTLSLGVIPTAQEYQYCGFDFIIPYSSAGIKETLIDTVGAKVIPFCAQGTQVWTDEKGVVGYFLADDTVYDVDLVRSWYDRMKAKTSKPVGSVFWRPPHSTDRNRLIRISNFLDFILPYNYPYRDGRSLEETNNYIAYMVSLAKDLNCPVILGAQAMDDDYRGMADPGEAGVRNQYEQYHNAGFPIWWYSWTNRVTDIRRNYQHLMHEWYAGVDNGEIIEDKVIVHTCNVRVSYQLSSFAENNDSLVCPNCGMALGVEGIRGSEQIIDEPLPEPGWCKPTGYTDPSGKWRNQTQLYDNIFTDDTGAYQDKNTIPEGSWGDFIYLSTAPIQSKKIRIYPDRNFFKLNSYQIDIDVKRDGSWVNVFSGHLSNNVWNEKTFTPGLVTEARIRVYKYPGVGWTAKIKEFEFESLVQEVISTQTITCSNCGSQLELTVSSIAEKNTEQYCPVCGEPAD